MIYTRLHGRLGNQMFQYAAASALASKLGVKVILDARHAQHRNEGVLTRVFDLPLAEPTNLPPARHIAPVRYAIWRAFGRSPLFQRERGLGFNPAFGSWKDNSYLHGYWQSEQYFKQIAADMRKDFTFPGLSDQRNTEMADQIGQSLAISLHVRRGDYLTLGAHVLCDQAYYSAALETVLKTVKQDPTVYVFSDDPTWAKENLTLPCRKVVVDFNGADADFEDMRLMSLCKHNIIANSSFSWWAAWLNTSEGKQVIGPARWFGDPRLNNPDILPPEWVKV